MKDYRIQVTVVFTIDVRADEKIIFDPVDQASNITYQVFKQEFSRAHLLKIDTEELLILE